MNPEDDADEHYISGCHGTLAPQKDEAFYDDRSDASDDLEKGRLKFPRRIYGRDRDLGILRGVYEDIIRDGEEKREEGAGEAGECDQQLSDASSPIDPYNGSRVVFLSGYSGIGKSALVGEFVKEITGRYQSSTSGAAKTLYASGKYTEQSSAPFSAITEMMGNLVSNNVLSGESEHGATVRERIKQSDVIGPGTEGSRVLEATFPALAPLLDLSEESDTDIHPSMLAMKECTHEFLSIICEALEYPLVLFIDDLQWGDAASFDMLKCLLSSSKLSNVMFICAYRSNEVDDEHTFAKLMEDVKKSRTTIADKCSDASHKSVEQMDLFSLSPEAIAKFISDSVKKDDAKGVAELAEAVYQKTMGNIFFTRQALEELVRKNVLFYDVMCFEWRWVVSKVELADSMSDDVVETVKGKIRGLSADVQHVLIVMAYIPNALDVPLLRTLVNHGEVAFDEDTVEGILKEASEEGMLLLSSASKCHVFAHDRIRQASLEFAAEQDQTEMLLHISQVLQDVAGRSSEREWCIYVAVDLLNSLPSEKTNSIELIQLNTKVAKIARSTGSIEKENQLLHQGLRKFESAGTDWEYELAEIVWGEEYDTILDLYNAVIKSDHDIGSYGSSKEAIAKVLRNARSLDDKLQAHLYQLLCEVEETSNYPQGLREGVKILNLYGFNIPEKISKSYLLKEEAKLKLALRNRSYMSLTSLPVKDDVPIFELFSHVTKYAMYTSQESMLKVLAWKAIQNAIKRGMGKHLPFVVVIFATDLAKNGKVKDSQELGNVSVALCEKVHDADICVQTRFMAYSNVLPKLQPFVSSVEPLLECHKDMKLIGSSVETTLASMMGYFECFYAAGLELGPLLESKLVLVEELCLTLGRPGWLSNFQIYRQFALNMRLKTGDPTEFKGEAFNEEEELSKMNDNSRKMALRDSSSSRLQLAFVFGDKSVMTEMLERLKDYPLKDAMAGRYHNRMCFTGLAVFALGKKSKSFIKLGQDCLSYFAHLTKCGSVDGKPVYLFMLAMKSPSRKAFQKAIDACNETGLVHLEAMSREQYAIFLNEENDKVLAKDFLTSSYWRYQDWGASAKAVQLEGKYQYLKNSKRKDAKSMTLSTAPSGLSSTRKSVTIPSYSYNSTSKSRNMIFVKKK